MACKIATNSISVERISWPLAANAPATAVAAVLPQLSTRESKDIQQTQAVELSRQEELRQCRDAAFEAGFQKARSEASAHVNAASERLANTLRDLALLKRKLRSEAEADIVKLSLAIARRVLHREISADPESIQALVHACLAKLQNREISSVRVSPLAADSVRLALERARVVPAVPVIADGRMQIGDIVFETSLGDLDASVETQLKEIERGFADRLGIS